MSVVVLPRPLNLYSSSRLSPARNRSPSTDVSFFFSLVNFFVREVAGKWTIPVFGDSRSFPDRLVQLYPRGKLFNVFGESAYKKSKTKRMGGAVMDDPFLSFFFVP